MLNFVASFPLHCPSFSPYWPLAFLIFSTHLQNFQVVLLTNFVFFWFFVSRARSRSCSLFLCYSRQCRHFNVVEKRLGFVVVVVFRLKVRVAMRFTTNTRGRELEYEISPRLTGRGRCTKGRTDGHVNTNFVASIGFHFLYNGGSAERT